MTYRITRNSGDFYAAVPPNVILGPNNPTAQRAPINLIGRNKVSYGEAQNENFLWLTENFTGDETPTAPIRGQLWYDTTNLTGVNGDFGGGGELKLAVSDNAGDTQWLTVPVISQTTNEPGESSPGRLIIHNKETLKVRMNNRWFTIVTEVPEDKLFQGLIPAYEFDETGGNLVSPNGEIIARFARGAYIVEDIDGNAALGGDTQGVLRYGGVYSWEARITARHAENEQLYRVWNMSGAFHIADEDTQVIPGYPSTDPRYIEEWDIGQIQKSTMYQTAGTANWDVTVDRNISDINSQLTVSDLAEGEYFGFDFKGTHGEATTVPMLWSVYIVITGLT